MKQEYSLLQNAKKISITTKKIAMFLLEKTDLENVGKIWRELEKETPEVYFTARWDWVETWIERYGDVVDYWFLVAMQDDQPCGITIIVKEKHRKLPLPVKAYHIGTNGEPYAEAVQTIHNALLIKNETKKVFYKALVEVINQTFGCEEILFDEFDAEEGETILSALAKQSAITSKRETCRVMNFDLLTENKTEVLPNLGTKTRYSIRRSMKIFNDLTLEWAETEEQAIDILDELIDLYNKTWEKRERKGMFASKRFTAFQYAIVKKFLPTKNIILLRIKSKEYGTIACSYLFLDHGVGYGYQLGINYLDDKIATINKKRLQLGYVLHAMSMQACLDRGVKKYNFATGEYEYKQLLSNDTMEIMTISIEKGLKPKLRKGMVNMYMKMDASTKSPLAAKIIRKLIRK